MAETTNTWSRSYTLGLQGPSKKVFGVGLEGPNTFWGGTWSPRDRRPSPIWQSHESLSGVPGKRTGDR